MVHDYWLCFSWSSVLSTWTCSRQHFNDFPYVLGSRPKSQEHQRDQNFLEYLLCSSEQYKLFSSILCGNDANKFYDEYGSSENKQQNTRGLFYCREVIILQLFVSGNPGLFGRVRHGSVEWEGNLGLFVKQIQLWCNGTSHFLWQTHVVCSRPIL